VPGQNTFQVNVGYEVRRWDDFNAAQAATNIPVVFNYTLRDSAGNVVPLASDSQTFYDSVWNYAYVFIFQVPSFQAASHTLDIQPLSQLDSVSQTYYLTVTISHTNDPVTGQVITANTQLTPTNELLHFDGNLIFGGIGTTMSALGAPPPPANPPSGGVIPTTLSGAGGYVTAKTDHTYSGAGPLSVNLETNGDAAVAAGTVLLNAPSPDSDTLAGVRFQRGPVTLSSSGASADVTAILPTGFGYRLGDVSNLVVSAFLPFTGVPLTSLLSPANNLTYLPGTTIYAAEEDKPVWLVSDRIVWLVNSGTFGVPPTGPGATYVRAAEFAYLQSVSNLLVDPPDMGDKRSNDKYWLSLNSPLSAPTIRPDFNGNSLLTAAFSFGAGAFRAHFPYDTLVQWSGAGTMKIADDLVVAGASSVLNGATTVAVPYSQDCVDCGSGTNDIATPAITPAGGLFSFTPDGGLMASGPTTATVDLKWGYITSLPDFAQQAFAFTNGVFHMPGVFLRGD
ncbi:MAG: hypothetical protein KGR98_15540, partial [Verrucomicrobia bacterium]|nr:hypothetical protein [Verrucomicrobiota bacterium]